MKRAFILLINVILISFLTEIYSQNSLWLMNGKKLTIGSYEIIKNEEESFIQFYNLKGKQKKCETLDVFSITDDKGIETVFDNKNLFEEFELSENQLRNYVQGQYDANSNYKDNFALISSIPVGFVSVFYPPFVKSYLFPLYPSVYAGVLGLTSPKFKESIGSKKIAELDEFYVVGYAEAARKKRIKNSLIGSGAGLAAGILVAIITN